MGKITFITGGIKSGKSSYAVERAKQYNKRAFIATAVAFDDEMKKRIEKHKKERGNLFKTIEEPVYLSEVLHEIKNIDVCVVDCITVWINNLIYYNKLQEMDMMLDVINKVDFDLILVSNEVGMGIVPDKEIARKYVDLLGTINRKIVAIAYDAFFMISGVPIKIKGGRNYGIT